MGIDLERHVYGARAIRSDVCFVQGMVHITSFPLFAGYVQGGKSRWLQLNKVAQPGVYVAH